MSGTVGSTLSSGIQDISALLPLLGTEQCEAHVSAGLDNGYMYPAATPLSIFGSLGIARAGFKAFAASFTFKRFNFIGAEALKDGGFSVDENIGLSSITFVDDNGEICYGAEKRLAIKMKELHLNDPRRITIRSNRMTFVWNLLMGCFTLLFSAIAITPYIHLNLRGGSDHSIFVKWGFPAARVLGSYLVIVKTQSIMQNRILAITRRKLILLSIQHDMETRYADIDPAIKKILDSKESTDRKLWKLLDVPVNSSSFSAKHYDKGEDLENGTDASTDQNDLYYKILQTERLIEATRSPLRFMSLKDWGATNEESLLRQFDPGWPNDRFKLRTKLHKELDAAEETPTLLFLFTLINLFCGSCLIIVGYVGCFSIVQGSTTTLGPVVWLVLESVLSIIRVLLWSFNPKWDERTGINFNLTLASRPICPTVADVADDLQDLEADVDDRAAIRVIPEEAFLEQMALTSYPDPFLQLQPMPVTKNKKLTIFYAFARWSNPMYRNQLYITLFDPEVGHAIVCFSDSLEKASSERKLCFHYAKISFLGRYRQLEIQKKVDARSHYLILDRIFIQQLEAHYWSVLICVNVNYENSRGASQRLETSWGMTVGYTHACWVCVYNNNP